MAFEWAYGAPVLLESGNIIFCIRFCQNKMINKLLGIIFAELVGKKEFSTKSMLPRNLSL